MPFQLFIKLEKSGTRGGQLINARWHQQTHTWLPVIYLADFDSLTHSIYYTGFV